MKYTKKQLANDLMLQLRAGFDIERICQWAYLIGIDRHRDIDPELGKIIEQVAMMGEGYQFEFSEQELWDLVHELSEDCVD
ncbi:MAG: hypothetical protein F6K30_07400 [Cyanothece sp. SIO2G6]|nr:hypothetical protein [Cyanothece sp. SIO2G6]